MTRPRLPAPDETLEGLSELSRTHDAPLVSFIVGEEEPAWLVNDPTWVHEVLERDEDFLAAPHPFAELPALYTPSGSYMLGLGARGHARETLVEQLLGSAHAQANALADDWLTEPGEAELERGLRELSAAWASQALYGVDMGAEVPRLVRATLAYEDERFEHPAGPDRALAELEAFCATLLERRAGMDPSYPNEAHRAAASVLPTLLNASVATALTLAWTLYLLAEHPEALARVEAEVLSQDGSLDARLPRCRAAVLESLRLYPPTWLLMRSVARPVQLGEHHLRPGELLALCPWTLHRGARWWPAAERFDPTRFERKGPPQRGAWLPFGHGPQRCVGAHVALPFMVTVLAALLRRVRPQVTSAPAPQLAARVSLRCATPLRLGFTSP